ncbi:hypothetical protein [Brevundimonas bullata]|uniref:hypothetical protein n=1 Tax=Brevundimonas bullata TaxID=13160 RepID=UPI002FD89C4D
MAAGRIIIPNYMPALDINGNPVAGARLTFYQNKTTTLATTYTDATLSVPHPNPVIAGADGVFPAIFADTLPYFTVAITDASGAPIGGLRHLDDVQAAESMGAKTDLDGGNVPRANSSDFRTALHIYDVRPEDFGPSGGDVADSSATLQAAIDYARANNRRRVFLGARSYRIQGVVLGNDVDIIGSGRNSTFLVPAAPGVSMFVGTDVVNASITDASFQCIDAANVVGVDLVRSNNINLSRLDFYGCRYNWRLDRGGHPRIIDCSSSGTATLKSGAVWMGSTDDAEYGGGLGVVANYKINDNANGVQDPAIHLRRAVAIEFPGFISNLTEASTVCWLIEDDCQGIVPYGLTAGYGIGAKFILGSTGDRPIFNDIRNMKFDQCVTHAIRHEAGRANIIGGYVTSSFIGTTSEAVVITGSDSTECQILGLHVSGYYGSGGAGLVLANTTGHYIADLKVSGCDIGLKRVGTLTDITIHGGDISEDVVTPISGLISGAGNRISGLKGFDASAYVSPPTVPADGVDVTNDFGVAVRVATLGGDVSAWRNGNNDIIGFGNLTAILAPGEKIRWQSTGGPTPTPPGWFWTGTDL